jgi:hypothetical protein
LRIIEVHSNWLVIKIRRSKTNQHGDDEELPPGPRWPNRAPSPRCRPGSNRLRSLICLPFKAKAVREKGRADFEAVLPRMSSAQRAWLHTALERVHPDHDWISATE